MQNSREFVDGFNKESSDSIIQAELSTNDIPVRISIRFCRCLYDEVRMRDNLFSKLKEGVKSNSDETMFICSENWAYENGIVDLYVSPKAKGFSVSKAIDTTMWIIKFLREHKNPTSPQ